MTTKNHTVQKPRSRRKAERIWQLITNHQNMLYMLAAGMVMSPAGFRGKHYSDSLSVYPGWIPLFPDKLKIPADVLHQAVCERAHLRPCIASFDLSDLRGPVRILSRDGKMRDVAVVAARRRKNDMAILLQAPLATKLIPAIHFRSDDDKQAFERAANDVTNVDLGPYLLAVAESKFSGDHDLKWPPENLPAEQEKQQAELFSVSTPATAQHYKDDSDTFPAFGQAVGGVLAMLYHTANRSDLGIAVYRAVTAAPRDNDSVSFQDDAVLRELDHWLLSGEISAQADTRARIFWGLVQALVTAQIHAGLQTPVDVALGFLENQLDLLHEKEFRPRLERLIADLRGLLGLGAGTITELLERHKGSLSRPLLLFCLREHCIDLLEFSHPLLCDAEYIVAAVLFGVRDGWLNLPKELRDPALSAYVDFRMAAAAHRTPVDKLFVNPPPAPQPLRELFASPSGEWNKAQNEGALYIAHKCNWQGCIQTHITLAPGDHPEAFKREGLQIVLPGRVTVREEVNKANFMRRLAQWPPPKPNIESELRKQLATPC